MKPVGEVLFEGSDLVADRFGWDDGDEIKMIVAGHAQRIVRRR